MPYAKEPAWDGKYKVVNTSTGEVHGKKMTEDPRGIPDSTSRWLSKVLGILVTGFALSMGAPFWFDVLNKVARLRTAVKPARSDEADGDGAS